ncbi:MAG: hypothetical protein ACOYBP_05065 [Microbacteriaceae bacterium]
MHKAWERHDRRLLGPQSKRNTLVLTRFSLLRRVMQIQGRLTVAKWVDRFVTYVADHPASPLGRLAALRYGTPVKSSHYPTSSFGDRPFRVLIAPVNYSAQGFAWARALEARDQRVSASNMSIEVPGGFAFNTGLEVPVPVYHNGTRWQRRQFETVAAEATHVLIEALESPFGRLFSRSVSRQALELERRGVKVAFIEHGTEVRLPSRHAASDQWSVYRDGSQDFARAEQVAARNISYLGGVENPVFVSTPDLLLDLPFAHWCPVVVEPTAWTAPRPGTRGDRPLRVTHAPTNPTLKGTPLIEPMLHRLEQAGVIQLQLAHGVNSAEMRKLYANTDVYLDQFRLGSYGVAACEAMAAGCVVVGHVSEQVRQLVERSSGLSLPIVQATPDSLEAVLRELATAESRVAVLATQGEQFVNQVHDGRLSSAVLLDGFILR